MRLLDQLQADGYRVKISHHRQFELPAAGRFWGTRGEHPALKPQPHGGFTVATVWDADGNLVASATSRCSQQDNYCRNRGMTIALGRAYCHLTGESKRRKERNES